MSETERAGDVVEAFWLEDGSRVEWRLKHTPPPSPRAGASLVRVAEEVEGFIVVPVPGGGETSAQIEAEMAHALIADALEAHARRFAEIGPAVAEARAKMDAFLKSGGV